MSASSELLSDLSNEIDNCLTTSSNGFIKLLDILETATAVSKKVIFWGLILTILFYLVLGYGAELVCNFIGMSYPAYQSIKALKTETKDDDEEWLIYWSAFGVLHLFDFVADKIMGAFPVYWMVKCCFMVYLYCPLTRGAWRIYYRYIEPAYNRLVKRMEQSQEAEKSNVSQTEEPSSLGFQVIDRSQYEKS